MSSRNDPARNVPKRLRFTVLSRDNFTCQYCGRMSARDGIVLQVDHIVPFSQGGKTVQGNLITACQDCNGGKGARKHDCGQLGDPEIDEEYFAGLGANEFAFADPNIYPPLTI